MRVKRLHFILVFVFLMLQNAVVNGQDSDVVSQIRETIKAGSAKELAKYLNQTVDITIEEKVESYSKPQAEFVLRDFFKTHPPNEFNILHQGSSKGGQAYAIGLYKTGDITYRI